MRPSGRTMAFVLAGVFAVLIGPRALRGEAVNATLLGTVTDVSGAVVAGAKVTSTEMKTGVGRKTTTDDSGNYEFSDLPPGQYQVAVEREGFKKSVRSGVDVLVNSDVRVNLALEPGALTQTVTVTSEAPILQTERADTGRRIETRQVDDRRMTSTR